MSNVGSVGSGQPYQPKDPPNEIEKNGPLEMLETWSAAQACGKSIAVAPAVIPKIGEELYNGDSAPEAAKKIGEYVGKEVALRALTFLAHRIPGGETVIGAVEVYDDAKECKEAATKTLEKTSPSPSNFAKEAADAVLQGGANGVKAVGASGAEAKPTAKP